MTNKEYEILTNIVGGVESGGQKYGQRNFASYAPPYNASQDEHTCTLGWCQLYGDNAQKLVQAIYDQDKEAFTKADTANIKNKLSVNWVKTRWKPSDAEKNALINIITTETGKKTQDAIFLEIAKTSEESAKKFGLTSPGSIFMYIEIAHLGGDSAAQRIFKKISRPYTVDKIFDTLMLDQSDTSNNNQVGDKIYQSRHECCVSWIKQYVPNYDGNDNVGKEANNQTMTDTMAKSYTEKLLKHYPFTYCPTLAACTTNTIPHKGDVVLFYRKGTFAHTGIVYKVSGSTYYTIEGNTSGASGIIANGGGVCKKSYSITDYQGTKFFRPDYSMLVKDGYFKSESEAIDTILVCAEAEVGYLEKKSNANLNDKTANAGSNNYTKYWLLYPSFQGQAWCAIFVTWIIQNGIKGTAKDSTQKKETATSYGSDSEDVLKVGSTGRRVKDLQATLITIGYNCGKCGADGDFGKDTEKAVIQFQTDYGIAVDGVCGKETLNKLDEIYKKKISATTDTKFMVKVTANSLNIRTGAGASYTINGAITDKGVYTIVETKGNWGRLLSGMGWICLDYTRKL